MRVLIIPFILLFTSLWWMASPPLVDAQQMGEIAIEDIKAPKSTYQIHQESVIDLFTSVHDKLAAPSSIEELRLSKDGLMYLDAVYLHCSIQKGACPLVLEALLNLDILDAAKNNTFECPNLTQFWRNWLENDMEERQKYLVRTAHLHSSVAFNQSERPKYIKCKDTVQSILSPTTSASSIVATRFAEGSDGYNNISQMLELLRTYRAKVPNVFALIQESPEVATKKKKK